jgi:hypothetical protein
MFLALSAFSVDFTPMGDSQTYPKPLRLRCEVSKMRPSGWGKFVGKGRDGMTARRRPVRKLIVVGALALACAGPASAATSQKIYKDLADNGRLDGRYTRAEIAKAFNLERVVGTDQRRPAQAEAQATVTPTAPAKKRSSPKIPFTGLDVALLTVGGGPLLLIGIGLRRRLSAPSHPAGVVRS